MKLMKVLFCGAMGRLLTIHLFLGVVVLIILIAKTMAIFTINSVGQF
jgi:hypothetical protein